MRPVILSTHYMAGTSYMPAPSAKKRLWLEVQFWFLKYIGRV